MPDHDRAAVRAEACRRCTRPRRRQPRAPAADGSPTRSTARWRAGSNARASRPPLSGNSRLLKRRPSWPRRRAAAASSAAGGARPRACRARAGAGSGGDRWQGRGRGGNGVGVGTGTGYGAAVRGWRVAGSRSAPGCGPGGQGDEWAGQLEIAVADDYGSGSIQRPLSRSSKCTCGPHAAPVCPTSAMRSPRLT